MTTDGITPEMVRLGTAELERRLFDLHCDPSPRVYSEVVVAVYRAMREAIRLDRPNASN